MIKRESWRCTCGKYGALICDWPTTPGAHCDKPICQTCVRHVEGMEICPFHRGDPPHIEERKRLAEAEDALTAGAREAENAARILGVKWP